MAAVPRVIADGGMHDEIVGGLLDTGVVEVTVIVPQLLDDDAPLESVAVTVTK